MAEVADHVTMRENPVYIRVEPGGRPDMEAVNEVVETVADAGGDLTLAFSGRVGATPYLRPTPYRNHRGTVVRMWSCISVVFKRRPCRTLLLRQVPVWPDEKDDYNVNMFTREWVWDQVYKSRYVEVAPAEESPFLVDGYAWDSYDDSRGDNDGA